MFLFNNIFVLKNTLHIFYKTGHFKPEFFIMLIKNKFYFLQNNLFSLIIKKNNFYLNKTFNYFF